MLFPPYFYFQVPRGWWKGGLLADLKYYNPFNLASSS